MTTIACVTKVLPNTAVAGSQFNNGRSYRIFYQSPDSAIHAFYTDNFGATWAGGDAQIMVQPGLAMAGTPMSTVMWTYNGVSNSRTFYLNPSGRIRMFGVEGGRLLDQELRSDLNQAATYSKISAIAWTTSGAPHIRVYFQRPDDAIQELGWEYGADFYLGHKFPVPLKGTALAFINRGPKDGQASIRGYYQHTTNQILEICWDGSWGGGNFQSSPVEPQAHIAASCSTSGQMNVYWSNKEPGGYNSVTECVWMGGWRAPVKIAVCCSASAPRFLSTSHVPDGASETRIRLFFLGMNGRINDARRENGHWGWGGTSGGACQWTPC